MQFKDVIGQQEVKQRLVGSVDRGRSAMPSYLRGRGRRLPLAIAYAQYLNCPHRHDGDSCGVCPRAIRSTSAHPDLHFLFFRSIRLKESSSEKPLSNQFMPFVA